MVRISSASMLFVSVLELFGFHIVTSYSVDNRYCNIPSCKPGVHTACLYTSKSDSDRIIDSGLSDEEKRRIVDLHNELRQKVAKGLETRGAPGPQPAAASMPLVEWDEELAEIAQKWANQLIWGHDKCRDVERFKVGQNIGSIATTGNVHDLDVEEIVLNWYDEVKDFPRGNVARFSTKSGNGSPIGHYSQMIWANSTHLGCGAVKYTDGNFKKFYLVANYGPAGNFLGQPCYQAI